ncbi:hypothetical protein ACFL5V_11325 [Fibrobacterota bacterium]
MTTELLSHSLIYLFTFIGLAMTPPSLKILRWIFPSWFLIVNLLLFSGIRDYHFFGFPVFNPLITQLPWILVTAYIITASRQKMVRIDSGEWTLWCSYRLMGIHYFPLLFAFLLPQEFALRMGVMETLVGLGALLLYLLQKKNWSITWYIFVFWNALGLISAWRANTSLQVYTLTGPSGAGQREIVNYFNLFPEIWQASFWAPLSIGIHLILFYDIWTKRRSFRKLERGS